MCGEPTGREQTTEATGHGDEGDEPTEACLGPKLASPRNDRGSMTVPPSLVPRLPVLHDRSRQSWPLGPGTLRGIDRRADQGSSAHSRRAMREPPARESRQHDL